MTPLSVFALLFVLCAIGRGLATRRLVPEGAAATLNAIALYVCLPASVLRHAPKLQWERSLLGLVAIPWLLLACTALLLYGLSSALRFERSTRASLWMLVPLGNTSFLGYSLCPALAGEESLKYAVVYDQLGSFVILSTYGLFVLASFADSARPSVATLGKRLLSFPPFLALCAALLLVPAELPAALDASLAMVAAPLLPLVALALGMQLKLALPRAHVAPVVFGVALKLLVLPAIALGLCSAFAVTGAARSAAVLESAMPTMITAGALLAMAGIAPELSAAIVGYSTLLSALTLPLWRALL